MQLNRTIIPGPPGTGKTERLLYYLDKEILQNKVDPKKIAYISFSNAAADEARSRAFNQDVNICTMHSMGTKELNINTNTQLLKNKKWIGFQNYSRICKGMSFESYIDEAGIPRYKNPHMRIIEFARSKLVSLLEAAIQLNLHHSVDLWLTEQIDTDLKVYKEHESLYEFSDMISKFVEKDRCPPVEIIFLDEAQDLSPLQWRMFFYIESKCKRSYIAGDDDQTIYTFQGADPTIFINLKGTIDAQIKSRRVPRKMHALAESIFPHIKNRLEKKWEPRDAEGEVYDNMLIEDIDFSKENWMILTRTNEMLQPVADHLYSLNLRFDSKVNNLLPKKLLSAYRTLTRLNKGASVSKEDVQDLYEYLNYHKGHVKYGYSGGKSLESITTIDVDMLRKEHGFLLTGGWEQLHMPDESKNYVKSLLDSKDDLMKNARIKISTVHGVKGEECDNVVLFMDLERIIYEAAQINADPEHRLFFVGVTRAKKKLYIMQPTSDYFYRIGDPIV